MTSPSQGDCSGSIPDWRINLICFKVDEVDGKIFIFITISFFMKWYKITAKETHVGGKKGFQVIYIWAKDTLDAIDRYKMLGGVPRNKIPEIRPLNLKESSLLEKIIVEDRKWNVWLAKKKAVRYDGRGDLLPPV